MLDTRVVGLISKAGHTGFTERKVSESSEEYGKSMQTTVPIFKMLVDEMAQSDQYLA